MSQRVDAVKDENLKLKSENQVLKSHIPTSSLNFVLIQCFEFTLSGGYFRDAPYVYSQKSQNPKLIDDYISYTV